MKKITWRFGAAFLLSSSMFSIPASQAADMQANEVTRIDTRIAAWQPTKEERHFDDIGWASDIRDAFRLAKEHQRPVFLFTYSGSAEREHAMALQRC